MKRCTPKYLRPDWVKPKPKNTTRDAWKVLACMVVFIIACEFLRKLW